MSKHSFQWQESHIDWFVNKFKNTNKNITTASFSRQYIPKSSRTLTAQDRRNLMYLVVVSGYATVVEGDPNTDKFKIRMNSEGRKNFYFDPDVLIDPRISDLPRVDCFAENPTLLRFLIWLKHKMRWLEICNLLRHYQSEGKIDEKYLQHQWNRNKKKEILQIASEQVALYQVIEIALQDPRYSSVDVNILFLDMLEAQAEFMFRLAVVYQTNFDKNTSVSFNQIYNLKKMVYGYITTGQDEDGNYTPQDAEKADQKLLDLNLCNGLSPQLCYLASGLWLINFQTENNFPQLQEAINKWLGEKMKTCYEIDIPILNRYRRSQTIKRQLKKLDPILYNIFVVL